MPVFMAGAVVQLGINLLDSACLLVVRADIGTSMPCALLATNVLKKECFPQGHNIDDLGTRSTCVDHRTPSLELDRHPAFANDISCT